MPHGKPELAAFLLDLDFEPTHLNGYFVAYEGLFPVRDQWTRAMPLKMGEFPHERSDAINKYVGNYFACLRTFNLLHTYRQVSAPIRADHGISAHVRAEHTC